MLLFCAVLFGKSRKHKWRQICGYTHSSCPAYPASVSLVYQPCSTAAWWEAGSLLCLWGAQAAVESPWPGSLPLELLSSWREPSSTQSWSLDSFASTGMVQPRGIQSRSTMAGGHACGCNNLSALTGEA